MNKKLEIYFPAQELERDIWYMQVKGLLHEQTRAAQEEKKKEVEREKDELEDLLRKKEAEMKAEEHHYRKAEKEVS